MAGGNNWMVPVRRSIMLSLWMAMICISKVQTAMDVTSLGNYCISDQNCNPPYIVCSMDDNRCAHKKLFPMTGIEIGSLFIMLVFLMVSIIVSIAGGIVIVPLASYLMGFNARQAVGLANSVVVLTSFVKYLIGLMKTNPEIPYKTIVDYNSAILMIPPMALFSTIGGIIVAFLPDVLILFMLLLILIFAMVTGYFNLRRQIDKERSVPTTTAASGHNKQCQGQLNREAEISPQVNSQLGELPQSREETLNKIDGQAAKISANIGSPERASIIGEPQQQRMQTEANGLLSESRPQESKSLKIEAQKKVESSNFVWKKFSVIVIVLILSILVAIFRAGKGIPSVVGIQRCSAADWMILVVYAILMAFIPVYCFWIIFGEQEHKQQINWEKDSTEVHFDKGQYIFGVVWSGVSGALSTILGIGGGILLNPLLMKLQFMPVTSSWTINVNTLLAKVAAILVQAMAGDLLYDYVFFYGGIIVVGIIISENTILEVIKKTKSQLFYPIAFLIVISICLVFVLYVGIDNWVTNSSKGINVWKFLNYC